jgi:hypothetical protein
MAETAFFPIRVEFVDDETDEVYASAELDASQLGALPEVADEGTVISLGQLEWEVSAAMPLRRSEAAAWGVWRIRGRAGKAPPPPTVSETDSARGEGEPVSGSLVVPALAWRQFEVLSPELGDEVDREVELVKDALRAGADAWPHVRDIPAPCKPYAFELSRLMGILGAPRIFDGLALGPPLGAPDDTRPDPVVGGFGFVSDNGTVFYGVIDAEGVVEVLGVLDTNRDDRDAFRDDLAGLQDDVLQADDMILIPWLTIRPDEDD